MLQQFTAFEGPRRLITGSLAEVALAVKRAAQPAAPIIIFSDATGRSLDLDLRGSDEEIVARLPKAAPAAAPETPAAEPRGRGRPRLGVVAREVTLLPRHWEWLNRQPGGASVALRKLVDEARKANEEQDRVRESQEAAYRFMSAVAGNEAGFEEAARALFGRDAAKFARETAKWPSGIREYALQLAGTALQD